MRKIIPLGFLLLASCHKSAPSYLDEAAYPSSCTGREFTSMRLRFQSCTSGAGTEELFNMCLTSIRPLFDKLPSACRDNLNTRSLVGAGIKDIAKRAVDFSAAESLKPAYDYSAQVRWTTQWLTQYTNIYATTGSIDSNLRDLKLGLEYNLTDVNAGLVNAIQQNAVNALTNSNSEKKNEKDQVTASLMANAASLDQYLRVMKEVSKSYTDNEGFSLQYAFILTQVLRAMTADLDVLTSNHDAVCAITKCESEANDFLAQAIDLMSALDRPELFLSKWQVLKQTNFTATDSTVYRQLFELFAADAEKVGKAFSKCHRDLNIDTSDLDQPVFNDAGNTSIVARNLVNILSEIKVMNRTYQTSGVFANRGDALVDYPFNKSVLTEAIGQVSSIKSLILGQRNDFIANRANLLQLLQRSVDSETAEIQNKIAFDNLVAELTPLLTDIDGLQKAITRSEADFEGFMGQIDSLKDGLDATAQYAQANQEPIEFELSASESLFFKSKTSTLVPADYAVKAIELKAGEIIRLDVQGQWSPMCALRAQGFKNLPETGVLTDSAGYAVTLSNGNSNVQSYTHTQTETKYIDRNFTASICAKAGVSDPFPVIETSVEASACVNYSQGHRSENSNSDQNAQSFSDSKTANFSGAMRFAETPFPAFPGGSLLGFVMPSRVKNGKANLSADTTVVAGRSSFTATEDSTLYLVVNDCAEGNLNVNKLRLGYTILRPASAQVSAIMNDALPLVKSFRAEATKLLKEGTDISAQAQVLRNDIHARILSRNVQLSNLPSLSSILTTFLDHESLQVERQARINQKRRESDRLYGELRRAQAGDTGYQASSMLSRMQAKWAMDTFDANLLGYTLKNTAQKFTKDYASVLRFYVGKDFIDEKMAAAKSNALGGLKLGSTSVQTAATMDVFYQTFATEAALWGNLLKVKDTPVYVALRYPNPFRSSFEGVQDLGDIPTVDDGTSRALWESIFDKKKARDFIISPSFKDLYNSKARFGYISCFNIKPVIEDTALVFVTSDSLVTDKTIKDLNSSLFVDYIFGPSMTYFDSQGPHGYALGSGTRSGTMKVGFERVARFADTDLFTDIFPRQANEGAGSGLSPFADTKFDQKSVQKVLDIAAVRSVIGEAIPATNPVPSKPGLGGYARSGELQKDLLPSKLSDIIMLYKLRVLETTEQFDGDFIRNCRAQ